MILAGPRVTLRNSTLDDLARISTIRHEPEVENRWGILEEGELEEFLQDDKTFVVEA